MEREQGEEMDKKLAFDPSTGAMEKQDPKEQVRKANEKSDDWREQK